MKTENPRRIVINDISELFQLAKSGSISVGDWIQYIRFKEKITYICGLANQESFLVGISTISKISERVDSTRYRIRERFYLESGTCYTEKYLEKSSKAQKHLKELREAA